MRKNMTPPELTASDPSLGEDPRRIREHLMRSCDLATTHGLPSVVVGLAGGAGDRMTPEFLTFVESALRVEDNIFRMTRDRAVLFLADVDREKANEILERLLVEFEGRFPSARPPTPSLGFYDVAPGCRELAVKDVLPAVFPTPSEPTH
jgi:hypothetical protein